MSQAPGTRSVVVERKMPHPPEKVWRALTQAPLIDDWLMANDFEPVVGHRFNFRSPPRPQWNGVVDCEVLEVDPPTRLVYSWNASGEGAKDGLRTTVTWTLAPMDGGTHMRMEQAGFRPQDENNRAGAAYGWERMVAALERVAGEGSAPQRRARPPWPRRRRSWRRGPRSRPRSGSCRAAAPSPRPRPTLALRHARAVVDVEHPRLGDQRLVGALRPRAPGRRRRRRSTTKAKSRRQRHQRREGQRRTGLGRLPLGLGDGVELEFEGVERPVRVQRLQHRGCRAPNSAMHRLGSELQPRRTARPPPGAATPCTTCSEPVGAPSSSSRAIRSAFNAKRGSSAAPCPSGGGRAARARRRRRALVLRLPPRTPGRSRTGRSRRSRGRRCGAPPRSARQGRGPHAVEVRRRSGWPAPASSPPPNSSAAGPADEGPADRLG